MSVPKQNFQTHFVTNISPAHHGNQNYLHQDVHHHLAGPNGNLVSNGPIYQDNHRPLTGQTTLLDFSNQRKNGLY